MSNYNRGASEWLREKIELIPFFLVWCDALDNSSRNLKIGVNHTTG
ncbi:hypothetical protein [Salinisphaera sp. G21_0]|nr:hypothetical protein [Salinisphaera sp. G21_0]MBO9484111.1 hypothetical protein [Salinisphaera sp. G21_0]